MYNNLQDFKALVSQKITEGELNIALGLIIGFVESIVKDSRATARIFGSEILDDLCQSIGRRTIEDQKNLINSELELDDDLIIYVATELYITGGHTAVLEDFIKFQPEKKHLILLTDLLNTGESEDIKNRFSFLSINLEWAKEGTYLDKLCWLQKKLIVNSPSQIFLFNHHQDAIAIASVQPDLKSQIIFYHHCDHQLSLGLYLHYAKHIDLHAFGYYNCQNNLRVKNITYIPLVAEDLKIKFSDRTFLADQKLRTCSSGHANKFEAIYSYSYAEEVPKILSVTGGWHIHIGHLSPQTLETIKIGLEKAKIETDRFTYIPWVKSLWQSMYDQKIDVYISSFPYGGGRASVEVMGSGTPIIGHQNYHSSVLSCTDIIYPEAFFWRSPEELYEYLELLSKEKLIENSAFSRMHYEKFHTRQVFIKCLNSLRSESNIIYPSPLKKYFRDELQVFLDDILPSKLELARSQFQLQQSQDVIVGMERSIFWKLRNIWFEFKKIFATLIQYVKIFK